MISKLALGTVQFGMPYGISNTRGQVPLDEVRHILHEAHNAGIDTIDTAYAYGDSEATLGKAISETQTFKIVTKFPAADQGKSPRHFWQESCTRLGNRPIYAYLLHNYHSFQERLHLVDFLQELKNRGEVERTGFSLYHPKELEEILTRNLPCEILQVPYSILDQRFACYFPELHQRGIEIHTRSSFLQGLVFRDPTSLPAFFSPALPSLQRIRKEAETLGVSVADFCLTFCLMNNHIDRVVIGVESIENLRDNIRCAQNANSYSSHPFYKEDFALNQPQILNPALWEQSCPPSP